MRRKPLAVLTAGSLVAVIAGGLAIASTGRIEVEETLVVYRLFADAEKTEAVGIDRVVQEYIPGARVMVQVEFAIKGRGEIYGAGTIDSFRRVTRSRSSGEPRSSRGCPAPSTCR